MNLKFKKVETIDEFIDAVRLRVDVFIKEQGFQVGWEPDNDDKISKHFVAIVDKKIVATARFRETKKGEIKIERMVTKKDYRGKGIGKDLVKFMIKEIEKLKPEKIWLRSQVKTQPFYERCGFERSYRVKNFFTDNYDHPIFEGDIQLVDMIYLKKDL